jgi:LPXTG-motif cell wall-anchored protein
MRLSKRTLAGAALFVAGLIATAPLAEASEWNKKTILNVEETIEIPGATLDPGTYVVQLVDIQSNRHVVQFKNEAEDEVISTVIAIPNYRMEPTGDTEFGWYETAANQPPALRAWFYPGDNFGQEFVYDDERSQQLAQGAQNVMTAERSAEERQADVDLLARQQQVAIVTAEDEEAQRQQELERRNAELAQQQREAEAREREEARRLEEQRQREIAEQQRQQQEQMLAEQRAREQREREERERELMARSEQQQQTRTELPQTGGAAPLLGLLSLLSLGSAAGLGALRRRR